MKKNIFLSITTSIFILTLIYFLGCTSDSDYNFDNQVTSREEPEINFRAVHDEYCELFCDSITEWAINEELDSTKVEVLWDILVDELSSALELTETEVLNLFDSISISSSNYTTNDTALYNALTHTEKAFIDDIEEQYLDDFESADSIIIANLDSLKSVWNTQLDSIKVDVTIEVAKSSCVYWKNNIEACIEDNTVYRGGSSFGDNKAGAARLAMGDTTGALWGLWGGLAGALLGATGTTLGTALQMAVFGW